MDALETHNNSSLCALKPRSQNLEQKSMKEKFVIKIEHLSVVFKTICTKLKYFRDSNKYNLNNMHITSVYIHTYCQVTTLSSYYFIILSRLFRKMEHILAQLTDH